MESLDNTALVLIGFQNDYFSKDGILHSFIEESFEATQAVKNIVSLLQQLTDTSLPIITTPIIFTPNYEELYDPVGILKTIRDVKAFQAGTNGSQTISELLAFGDRITEIPGKRGFNAFANTDLDGHLQHHNIQHVVLAGAVTSLCIDSTARSAHEKHYQVSILSDCISARTVFEQEFYLENVFPLYANTLSSIDLLHSLELSNAK
jgi:nicotinamidase-related amidase